MPWERRGVVEKGREAAQLALAMRETKVIKTAALKLGALDKTLFAARGLQRRKRSKKSLQNSLKLFLKLLTHPTTHAPYDARLPRLTTHDLRFMRHLTRVAAQVESSLSLPKVLAALRCSSF